MDNKVFLGKRRDRAIAILLSFKEKEVDQFLTEDVALRLRRQILDQFNEVVDTAFDLMSSESVYNEEFMNRFNDLYDFLLEDEA
jgi:hypothetical protein